MLKRVQVTNYKALANVTLELSPFTLLVGMNATGKTTLLRAVMDFLRLARHKSGNPPMTPSGAFRTGAASMELSGTFEQSDLKFNLAATGSQGRHWHLRFGGPNGGTSRLGDVYPDGFDNIFVQLSLTALRSLHHPSGERPVLEPSGLGLGSVLAFLSLNAPAVVSELSDRMRAVVPQFERFSFRRRNADLTPALRDVQNQVRATGLPRDLVNTFVAATNALRPWAYEILLDMGGASALPPSELSDGTLLALGLLTLVAQFTSPPRLLLIDELARDLHPTAQAELVKNLRELCKLPRPQGGGSEEATGAPIQILATTHSPYLLDHFDGSEVRCVSMDSSGATQVRTLSDHPDWDRWKEQMGAGEFWGTYGDRWMLEEDE